MSGQRELESHQSRPNVRLHRLLGGDQDGEEARKAYRDLPALLSKIHLHIFQRHQSTLSAMTIEDMSKSSARPSSGIGRDMNN